MPQFAVEIRASRTYNMVIEADSEYEAVADAKDLIATEADPPLIIEAIFVGEIL